MSKNTIILTHKICCKILASKHEVLIALIPFMAEFKLLALGLAACGFLILFLAEAAKEI